MPFRNLITKRDFIFVFVGALLSSFFGPFTPTRKSLFSPSPPPFSALETDYDRIVQELTHQNRTLTQPKSIDVSLTSSLPETTILSHAPGWTIFKDVYMAAGTLYILTDKPEDSFPKTRFMTSTGIHATSDPENARMREPTTEHMDFISPANAHARWGGNPDRNERHRVWTVEGNTVLHNDPQQFVNHYYHFVAELMFGTWAFWRGTFAPSFSDTPHLGQLGGHQNAQVLPIHRIIFPHLDAEGWRDGPGFNSYFLRAAFPSVTVETGLDWQDRINNTKPFPPRHSPDVPEEEIKHDLDRVTRAYHFPYLLLTDRSAAFRGDVCGLLEHRTAAEAWQYMVNRGRLSLSWWEPIRESILRFAGHPSYLKAGMAMQDYMDNVVHDDEDVEFELGLEEKELPEAGRIVITYISRQNSRRRLIPEDHESVVQAVSELADRRGWEFNTVLAETLTKDEQIRVASQTTIMLGVHGNGLTHLVWMKPTRVSAVIEIFFPGGFVHDYEWTARALGMRHFAVWNDTWHTHPKTPFVTYPEGFQGTRIPAYGPNVAKIIEDRIDKKI